MHAVRRTALALQVTPFIQTALGAASCSAGSA